MDAGARFELTTFGLQSATDSSANTYEFYVSSGLIGIGRSLITTNCGEPYRSFTNDKQLQVSNESVDDACEDIINYAILAKAMLIEERKKIEQEKEEQKKEKIYSIDHGEEVNDKYLLAD